MVVALLGLLLPWNIATAATYVATPADYLVILRGLRPGDTLLLSAGLYREGLPLHHMNGVAGSPIVIRGSREGVTTLVARPKANTISIVDSSYIEVRDLVLDGNGHFVDAVKAEGYSSAASYITLDGLTIKGHGADQQLVGISTKCPAWGWVIRNNVIAGAGTGMYLGQSDGSAPFVAGLIERNVIVDSLGYNIQIKHQNTRPAIAGLPEDNRMTVIRHNVFSKSANSSRGKLARPNLLVGHFPLSGPGSEDTYAVYGNFFYQNPSEALFQGEGNIAFYSNVLVNSSGPAINIQPHNALPRRIDVFRNTVLAGSTGIRINGGDPAYTQRVSANAVFASVPITGGEQQLNVTGTFGEVAEQLAAPFGPLGQLDLSPRPGRLVISPPDTLPPGLPDGGKDFDGKTYSRSKAGAYAGEGAGWRLRAERKP